MSTHVLGYRAIHRRPSGRSTAVSTARPHVVRPVLFSVVVHGILLAGALALGGKQAATPPPQEPIEVTLWAGGLPGGGGMGDDSEPAVAEAPAPPPPPAPAAPKRAAPPPPPVVEPPAVVQESETIALPEPEPEPELEPEVEAEEPVVEEAFAETEPVEREESVEETHAVAAATSDARGDSGDGSARGGGSGGGGEGAGLGSGTLLAAASPFGTGDEPVDGRRAAVPPKPLRQVPPTYPSSARRMGIEGSVVVHLVVGTDGKVETEHTKVLRSLPGLDRAAVEAANRWVFRPARDASGKPVRVFLRVPLQFSLR